ncbi:MAG: hypothetical protein Q8M22_13070 [Actinomycetota bacterium]|nr:hypothetical protein [Actinomycetota bacterium]
MHTSIAASFITEQLERRQSTTRTRRAPRPDTTTRRARPWHRLT